MTAQQNVSTGTERSVVKKAREIEDAAFVFIMATRGLRSVRESLLLAYDADLIDAEECAILYDEKSSSELFPYWKFEKFDFD